MLLVSSFSPKVACFWLGRNVLTALVIRVIFGKVLLSYLYSLASLYAKNYCFVFH